MCNSGSTYNSLASGVGEPEVPSDAEIPTAEEYPEAMFRQNLRRGIVTKRTPGGNPTDVGESSGGSVVSPKDK